MICKMEDAEAKNTSHKGEKIISYTYTVDAVKFAELAIHSNRAASKKFNVHEANKRMEEKA